jgi:AraC-like DNA-binding protein
MDNPQLYVLGEIGHIYTYTVYPSDSPAEPMCTILGITVDGEPMQLDMDGRRYSAEAVICAPDTSSLPPCVARTVAFAFYPPTATHRSVQRLPKPRIKILDRELFRRFDSQLRAAATGELGIQDALALAKSVGEVVASQLPEPPLLDQRVAQVASMLYADTSLPVDSLAESVKLSADRLSHLFTETLGVDMRRYRLWLKVGRAAVILSWPTLRHTQDSAIPPTFRERSKSCTADLPRDFDRI